MKTDFKIGDKVYYVRHGLVDQHYMGMVKGFSGFSYRVNWIYLPEYKDVGTITNYNSELVLIKPPMEIFLDLLTK